MSDIADYVSLLEAACELGLSKSRIDQYVKDGRLPFIWSAGRRMVLRSDVMKLKDSPRRPAGRPKKDAAPLKPKRKKKGGAS